MLHLLPDIIRGRIMWLFPFENSPDRLLEVRATRWHRVVSFLFYWTFVLEVAVWAAALWLYRFQQRHRGEDCQS